MVRKEFVKKDLKESALISSDFCGCKVTPETDRPVLNEGRKLWCSDAQNSIVEELV